MERTASPCDGSVERGPSTSADRPPPHEAVCRQLEANLYGSSRLKVYLRIRPKIGGRPFSDPAFKACNNTTVKSSTGTLKHQNQKNFTFTKVFSERSSQEQVYEAVQDNVDAFVKGSNVLLFAYGPTASGKTHTMEGPYNDPGVVPRALERVFRLLGPRVCQGAPVRPDCYDNVESLSAEEEVSVLSLKGKLLDQQRARNATDFSAFHLPPDNSDGSLSGSCDSSYGEKTQASLWLSFYEIHNESIYDLLLPSAEAVARKRDKRRAVPRLSEDRAKRTFVRGLIEVPVHSADEAHRLFAETKLNRSSSRSHCVLNVRLLNSGVDSQNWHVSTLMLCDLAGTERPSKAGNDGPWLYEGGRSNSSLLVLSRCLEGLRHLNDSSKKINLPFRESILTQAMQPFFTMGGQVSIVVNICPAMSVLEESLNALRTSAVAIEVLPQQLESRHIRCKEAVRHLREKWHHAIGGEGFGAGALAPNRDDGAVAPVVLDTDDAGELFETVQALDQELEDALAEISWAKTKAESHEVQIREYQKLVKDFEWSLHMDRERADREMENRIQNACKNTRLEIYRKAEPGSTMDLLGRLEEAQRRIAELEELNQQRQLQNN